MLHLSHPSLFDHLNRVYETTHQSSRCCLFYISPLRVVCPVNYGQKFRFVYRSQIYCEVRKLHAIELEAENRGDEGNMDGSVTWIPTANCKTLLWGQVTQVIRGVSMERRSTATNI